MSNLASALRLILFKGVLNKLKELNSFSKQVIDRKSRIIPQNLRTLRTKLHVFIKIYTAHCSAVPSTQFKSKSIQIHLMFSTKTIRY